MFQKGVLYRLWVSRWARSIIELFRGVQVHWSAELLASPRQIMLARRAKVGMRTRIVPGHSGNVSIGSGTWLSGDIEIQTDTTVAIGSGTTIQRRCTINGSVRIGHSCLLAPNVFISSGTHPFRNFPHLRIREQEQLLRQSSAGLSSLDRPVWVQDDCWLGVNSVVSPGITIGKGSVVGANAVVTKDVPPYSIVAGVPARIIGKRLNWVPPSRIDTTKDEDLVYILAGKITKYSSQNESRVVVSYREPLLAALDVSALSIIVYYEANSDVEFISGLHKFKASEGPGSVTVPTAGLPMQNGAVLFDLTLETCTATAALYVSCIELYRVR